MSADMGMTAREFWADDGKRSERIMAALAVIEDNRKTTEAAHRPLTPQSRCSALSSEDATRPTPEPQSSEGGGNRGHLSSAKAAAAPDPEKRDATRPTGDGQ